MQHSASRFGYWHSAHRCSGGVVAAELARSGYQPKLGAIGRNNCARSFSSKYWSPGDPFEVSDADTALAYLDPARSMGAVAMFARHGCPFCERAKTMLSERGIPFEAVYLGEGVTMSSVRAFAGAAKVPQIFIDGHLIGGPTRCRCSWIRTLARRVKRGRRRAAGRRRRGSAMGRGWPSA